MAPGGCVCTSISSGELPSITTIPHLQRVAGVGLGDDDRSLFPPLSIRLNPRFRGISYGQADKVLKFRTGDQVGTGVTGVHVVHGAAYALLPAARQLSAARGSAACARRQ